MAVDSEAGERRHLQERHRQVRGLLLIAITVLVLSISRAGLHRVFTHGWWRLW